jgi:endothelin-converting enzyme/putative endopeptidase
MIAQAGTALADPAASAPAAVAESAAATPVNTHPAPALPRPGDDFFRHVNGAWLDATEIPPDRNAWGGGQALAEQTNQNIVKLIEAAMADPNTRGNAKRVADFYAAWMDQAQIEARGLTPLQPLLSQIDAINSKTALATLLGSTLRADVDPLNSSILETENLFGLWVTQGLHDPAHYYPYLLQGGLGMPDRLYYLDASEKMQKLRAQYREHVIAVFKLAGLDQADARAERVIQLETALARIHAERDDTNDVQKADNRWQRADFARKAPGMDWAAFFAAAKLDAQQQFHIWQPAAISGAAKLVASVDLASWQDFLRFHSINRLAPNLNAALAQQHFGFYHRILRGTPEMPPRWKLALNATTESLDDAVGQMYVARYFPAQNKARIAQMVKNIVSAFDRRIDALSWMAPATRKEAKAKLKTLYVGVGYPEQWKSYDGLEILPGDALGNVLRAEQWRYRQQIAKLGQTPRADEWAMPPHIVNAINLPMQNALNFPAAILQAPYFDVNGSDAMNYGALGGIIGHEISHSFDDQGAQFDSKGRLRNWWSKADLAHFQQASQALATQYSGYRPFPDLAVNGKQTLSENLADLAGLSAAYDAYRAALPDKNAGAAADREFFVGYALSWREKRREETTRVQILTDGHAPAQYRTATVRNLDAWYKAFDVQPGQSLYLAPQQRVRVW